MHNKADNRKRSIYRVTFAGFIVNLVLSLLKLAAGIVGRSGAMVADAVHSFSDLATDVVVIAFARISAKPRDEGHDYGHGKYETLAAILIGLALGAVGAGILANGVQNIRSVIAGGELPRPGSVALAAAVVSIVVKEILYRYTVRAGRAVGSPSLVANAWHHRSDSFSSIATLAGVAGTMFLGRVGGICDPAAAIIVSIFIIIVAVKMAIPALHELLEISLPEEDLQRISEAIVTTPGVKAFHHLRTRRSGADVIVDMHIKVDPEISVEKAHDIASEVENKIRALYPQGTALVTVHIEPYHPTI